MLQLENISAGYGAIQVLHDVSLSVGKGEIVSVIGANGAGKSTLLRTISALVPCRKGRITFEGQDITHYPPHKVVEMGLIHVPEGRQVFAPLTTYENLLLGCYSKYRKLGSKGRERLFKFVFDLFPVLAHRRNQTAGTLSGGEQQMLAIGRALMAEPKLLVLDEPSLGLSPVMVETIDRVLRQLNSEGLTILLVEQNALMALGTANRAYVVDVGRIVLQGEAKKLLHDDKVREVYLGGASVR